MDYRKIMHRLFVALSVPPEISDRLTGLQNGLEGARWRPLENFHMTLAFIGEVDRHGLAAATDALSGIEAPAFSLRLSGIGSFGSRKPRAVWVGVEPSDKLAHLQSKVENALRNAGFELEHRKFTPHVTLAYLSGARREAVFEYCSANGMFSTVEFSVDAFHLYSSGLGSGASHYEVEASYSLSLSR
ncbi:MAG: RNA 2',3'-cyclic phosphodiesterase [Hyphococcus sp.]|nr:MAG: RNA 2',3'-cyclic phosphodiesterase [Marinicaulis sp.]